MFAFLILILVLLIQIEAIILPNHTSLVRYKRSCTPKIKIYNCKEQPEINRIYTYYHYYQSAKVIPGCPGNKMEKISWFMYDLEDKNYKNLEKYNNKLALLFVPGDYFPGEYIMTVKIKEEGGDTGTKSCKFNFIPEPPVLIFKQGTTAYVKPGETYEVDLTGSVNYDKKHPLNLTFRESTCENKDSPECDKKCVLKPEGGSFGIKFKIHINECHAQLLIAARVSFDNYTIGKYQMIYARASYLKTDIICEKNCDNMGALYTNPSLPTAVQLICYTNCSYLHIQRWTVEQVKKEANENIEPIRFESIEDSSIIVPADVLKFNTLYWIRCYFRGGTNIKEIRTMEKIIAPECDIQPRSGDSLKTVFTVSCNTTGHLHKYGPFYTLYQDASVGTKKGAILASSAFNTFDVIISSINNQPKQKLVILGYDMFYNDFEVALPDITVKEISLTENKINYHLDKIDRMFEEGNGDSGSKYSQAFLTELTNKEISGKVLNDAHRRLMTSINKLEVDSVYAYTQIVTFLPHFYKSRALDEDSKEQLGTLCKRLSNVQLSTLLQSRYSEAADIHVKQFTSITTTCADALLDEVNDDEEINVTYPDYIVSEPTIEEMYPNYDNVFINSQIEQIKKNAMETILKSSNAIATSLVAGELYEKQHENFDSVIMTNKGRIWPEKEIKINETSIKLVGDLSEFNQKTIAAVVTSYKNKLLESDQFKLDSNIIDINIFHKEANQQSKIEVKFELNMDVKVDVKSDMFDKQVEGNVNEWKDHTTIHVHRMDIQKGRQCMLIFENLKPTDKFQVVVIIGRRPNLDDFLNKSAYLLDGTKSDRYDINIVSVQTGDAFGYVGVLPHEDMLTQSGNLILTYQLTFVEEACLVFDPIPYTWLPGPCEAKISFVENKPKMKCICTHNSLFGASIRPLVHKVDDLDEIEFKTDTFINYTILIFVCIVFTCYCIALCFYIMRYNVMGGRDRVFFLSDNVKNDRFGYLVVVKTGSIDNSGTTSNIAFKILGEKFTCKPHVFNYPDPQKRLLQTGTTDCYVLSTEKFMGKINEIHLWFDSIGLRPSWYCERITVIDLQMNEYYYFKVEQWLTVLNTEQVQLKIQTSIRKNNSKNVSNYIKKSVRVYGGSFHTWNIVNKSHDYLFEYTERLTVILSIIYTTYVLNVLFLYVPNMKPLDIYGYGKIVFDYQMIVCAIGSSLLACLINYPFVFFFRNSSKHTNNTLIVSTPTLYSKKHNNITWAILMLYLVICVSYLGIFGFWVSTNTSIVWIINTTLSLLMSIFVVDNLYIIGMRLILLKLKEMHVETVNTFEVLRLAEKQRKILFKKFGEVLLRPYFRKHYSVLKRHVLTLAKSRETSRVDVGHLFKEMCLFIVFMLILYLILLAEMDYLFYTSNKQMRKMLEANFTENSLNRIYSISDIYDYINTTVLSVVHSVHWYGRFNSLDGGQMMDFKSKVLGIIQLRQQRREQTCIVPYELRDLEIICHNNAPVFEKWKYQSGSDISASIGLIQMYSGKGYTVLLGRTLYNSYYITSILKRNKWIDINTKVLFIEFWTYNVNFNIFNSVRIIIERSKSGFILTSINVETSRYIQSNFTMNIIIIMAVLCLILIVLIMLTKRIFRIFRNKMGYFKNFFNILDFVILSLSTAIIALYFMKKVIIGEIINELLESDRNEFINYFYLTSLSRSNIIISSVLLCIASIKLWKYFRFGKIFQVMEKTIKICALPILSTFGYHMWLLVSFSWYFNFVLGNYVHNFSSFGLAYGQLVSTLIGVQDIKQFSPFMNTITYISFLLFDFMSLTFNTIYITIILLSFAECKSFYSNRKDPYTIKQYFIDEVKYLTEISKKKLERLKAGGDDNDDDDTDYSSTIVYPKEYTERYKNSVRMNDTTLKFMQLLAMGVIRNVRKGDALYLELNKDDYALLARIFIGMSRWKTKNKVDDNDVIFFRAEDHLTKKVHYVPDAKMFEMETITKQLLMGSEQEESYEDNQMIIHIGYEKRLDNFKQTVDTILNIINHIKIV